MLAEKITRNKICVDLIRTYVTRRKGKEYNLHLKAVMMIDPVTIWFEIAKYEDKREISISNLVETMWLFI